jgi:hypothetical protein
MAAKSKGVTGPQNELGRPAWAHFGQSATSFVRHWFPSLLDPSPLCMWALIASFSPNWMKLLVPQDSTLFLTGSSEFVIFSGLVPGLLGVMFASLHDLYRASRSFHKVLDELIPKVLLSTLKPCINTKLQNQHTRMNLLYQGG